MTDLWSTQDGLIIEGFSIAFCYCTQGVTEGCAVTQHGITTVANRLAIDVSNAIGDGVGIALKTGSAGATVPVLFYGVYKMDTSSDITIGTFVINASGGATIVTPISCLWAKLILGGGNSYILGYALQAATSGDKILVLIGKGL